MTFWVRFEGNGSCGTRDMVEKSFIYDYAIALDDLARSKIIFQFKNRFLWIVLLSIKIIRDIFKMSFRGLAFWKDSCPIHHRRDFYATVHATKNQCQWIINLLTSRFFSVRKKLVWLKIRSGDVLKICRFFWFPCYISRTICPPPNRAQKWELISAFRKKNIYEYLLSSSIHMIVTPFISHPRYNSMP